MKMDNDDMTIWKQSSHMIMNGEVIKGDVLITTRNIVFMQYDDPRIFLREKKGREIWDLGLERIMDINLYDGNEKDFPFIRIHYKENDAYFTFPDSDPKSTIAAMIIFINHGRTISRMMNITKNIGSSLKDGTLDIGEELPKLIKDLPMKVDEECYQCGKPLMDDDMSQITTNIRECLSCIPEV